ncbi:mucin-2-like [Lytechinus pictus]|uniref:mucin-2-like n=1 Tax=Lytechinus pictus TaxID=7653 RepID=UPI0030BA130A
MELIRFQSRAGGESRRSRTDRRIDESWRVEVWLPGVPMDLLLEIEAEENNTNMSAPLKESLIRRVVRHRGIKTAGTIAFNDVVHELSEHLHISIWTPAYRELTNDVRKHVTNQKYTTNRKGERTKRPLSEEHQPRDSYPRNYHHDHGASNRNSTQSSPTWDGSMNQSARAPFTSASPFSPSSFTWSGDHFTYNHISSNLAQPRNPSTTSTPVKSRFAPHRTPYTSVSSTTSFTHAPPLARTPSTPTTARSSFTHTSSHTSSTPAATRSTFTHTSPRTRTHSTPATSRSKFTHTSPRTPVRTPSTPVLSTSIFTHTSPRSRTTSTPAATRRTFTHTSPRTHTPSTIATSRNTFTHASPLSRTPSTPVATRSTFTHTSPRTRTPSTSAISRSALTHTSPRSRTPSTPVLSTSIFTHTSPRSRTTSTPAISPTNLTRHPVFGPTNISSPPSLPLLGIH